MPEDVAARHARGVRPEVAANPNDTGPSEPETGLLGAANRFYGGIENAAGSVRKNLDPTRQPGTGGVGVVAKDLIVNPLLEEGRKANATTGMESVGHRVASYLPVAGPMAAQAGEVLGRGDPGGLLDAALALYGGREGGETADAGIERARYGVSDAIRDPESGALLGKKGLYDKAMNKAFPARPKPQEFTPQGPPRPLPLEMEARAHAERNAPPPPRHVLTPEEARMEQRSPAEASRRGTEFAAGHEPFEGREATPRPARNIEEAPNRGNTLLEKMKAERPKANAHEEILDQMKQDKKNFRDKFNKARLQ